jgi:hypothetical protein
MSNSTNQDDGFYADDVSAEAVAENSQDPEKLKEDQDTPVTSGEMEIGDMDEDAEVTGGSEASYDEEAMPGGDN